MSETIGQTPVDRARQRRRIGIVCGCLALALIGLFYVANVYALFDLTRSVASEAGQPLKMGFWEFAFGGTAVRRQMTIAGVAIGLILVLLVLPRRVSWLVVAWAVVDFAAHITATTNQLIIWYSFLPVVLSLVALWGIHAPRRD
jgi:hypothetical protein